MRLRKRIRRWASAALSEYGMALGLALLCAYYSFATIKEQIPEGSDAARLVTNQLASVKAFRGPSTKVALVADGGTHPAQFISTASSLLKHKGIEPLFTASGSPAEARSKIEEAIASQNIPDAILVTRSASQWTFISELGEAFPPLKATQVLTAEKYKWPVFLKRSNLMAIMDRIVVIAIIAIGMTMVIITAGIDLSVGSLIALSAVTTTVLIRDWAGAEQAGAPAMFLCVLAGVIVCALTGAFSGLMITMFDIPPFITTLAMMMVASGAAYILAEGQSIYNIPDSFVWLGRGADLFDIPNTVVLMATLYIAAHLLMTRSVPGRYIYAVGGNLEAARLSGVPVKTVLIMVYTISGALAGLGGVVQASQLKSGAPTYGQMYELYVIAAVVVGGASLAGGEGRVFGTLIGAFIIAVIQNGMNLTGVESYTQKVILGLVILGAVLIDMLKKRGLALKPSKNT